MCVGEGAGTDPKVRTLFVSGLPVDIKPRELYLLFRPFKVRSSMKAAWSALWVLLTCAVLVTPSSQHVLNGSISSIAAQSYMWWVRPDASASNPELPETFPSPILIKAVVPLVGKGYLCWWLPGRAVPPCVGMPKHFGVMGADTEQESWADDPRCFKLCLKALCSFRWSLLLAVSCLGQRGWQGSLRSWKRLLN
uniref:RRM domain-containing protein n=1 Tax=Buteo japonicus TaxID=224669 RepID=A0A8C0AND7_9AVES